MSLRQVLALSLQEAEEKAKSEPSTRENSPDATELGRVSAGSAAIARRERFEQAHGLGRPFGANPAESHRRTDKGKGKERLSDVSDFELAGDNVMSDLSSLSSDDDDADAVGATSSRRSKGLEKIEERQIRADIKRKQARRSADAMDLDRQVRAGGADGDLTQASSDEDDLAQAWDQNVLALGRLHHRASPDPEFGDAHGFFDDGEDSDLGVTEVPPGNGIGVVTWSDYEFDDEDEEEDDEEHDDDADDEEDLLAAALADDDANADPDADQTAGYAATTAGDFENELEQLFALSEAVAGPINPDEYDFGNVWLEALSGEDGDGDGYESDDFDSDDEGDSDAEMIFGPDGELKRLFGRRRKYRMSAVETSGDDADESGESSTSEREELDHNRGGLALEGTRPLRTEGAASEEDAGTDDSESTDEATDSSCSDTDIYRYAPRTGALAAVQAPTTAELASLAPAAPPAAAKPRAGKRRCHRHKAKSSLASIPERGAQPVPSTQPAPRKGPVLGSFEPAQRQPEAAETALKVVIVDGNGPAPSPFAVPKKSRRRVVSLFLPASGSCEQHGLMSPLPFSPTLHLVAAGPIRAFRPLPELLEPSRSILAATSVLPSLPTSSLIWTSTPSCTSRCSPTTTTMRWMSSHRPRQTSMSRTPAGEPEVRRRRLSRRSPTCRAGLGFPSAPSGRARLGVTPLRPSRKFWLHKRPS